MVAGWGSALVVVIRRKRMLLLDAVFAQMMVYSSMETIARRNDLKSKRVHRRPTI